MPAGMPWWYARWHARWYARWYARYAGMPGGPPGQLKLNLTIIILDFDQWKEAIHV